jgi:spore coat protein CotH
MKKLNLSNNFKDASAMREYLAYELFRKSGLCAGRSAFVKLSITVEGAFRKKSYGLYTAVEQVDAAFLRKCFGNAEGTLFKPEVFGADPLQYRSDNPRDYAKCELKHGELHPDYDELIQLMKLADKAPEEDFARKVGDLLDVDSFLKFLAVNALLANYDSYIGTGHNFYLYFDAPNGKFVFIPWDLNEAFGMFTPRGYNPKTCAGVSILKPVAMGSRALVERILDVKRWRSKYEEHLSGFISGSFKDDSLVRRVEELRKIIEPAIKEEDEKEGMKLHFGINQLKDFIKDRYAAAFHELMMR